MLCWLEEETGVAVAEEAESVVEGVTVTVLPVVAYESGDEEKESAFRLVEVGYQAVDDAVFVTWGYEQLCVAIKGVGIVSVEPVEDVCECLNA